MKKLLIINTIISLIIGTCFACEETHVDLFTKAREAMASKQICRQYNSGLDTAEALVQARIEAPSKTDKSPTLQMLLSELVAKFPTAPNEINPSTDPLTWQEYRLAVQSLIDWKTPKDIISKSVYHGSNPSKYAINLEKDFYQNGLICQGFIPRRHGILGQLTALICLANNIAPYGFPIAFEGNMTDAASADTTRFVGHDLGHHSSIYGDDFKGNWLVRGGLRDLLVSIPFTNELIFYLFHKIWDVQLYISLPSSLYHNFGEALKSIYPYLPNIYESLCGPNPFSSKEDLQNSIVSFMGGAMKWEDLPIVFKHVSNKRELDVILYHCQEPRSNLLQKMKEWGFVYPRMSSIDNINHAHLFLDLIVFIDRKGDTALSLLDTAFQKGNLTHKPDDDTYALKKIVEKVIEGANL